MTLVAALSPDHITHHRHRRAIGNKIESRACVVRTQVELGQVSRSVYADGVRRCRDQTCWRLGREGIAISVPDRREITVRFGSSLGHRPGTRHRLATSNVVDILLLALWDVRSDELRPIAPGVDIPVRSSGAPFGSSRVKTTLIVPSSATSADCNLDDQAGPHKRN